MPTLINIKDNSFNVTTQNTKPTRCVRNSINLPPPKKIKPEQPRHE
jgi:hypothetical protein